MPASMATSRNQGRPKLVLLSLPPLPSHLPPSRRSALFWSHEAPGKDDRWWKGWWVQYQGGEQKKICFQWANLFCDSISVGKAILWWRHSSQNTSSMQDNCLWRMLSRFFTNLIVSIGCHTFGSSQNLLTSEWDKPQPVCAEWRPDSSQNRDGEEMVLQFRKGSSQNWL